MNGRPYQTRWVQTYNEDGHAISISKDEYTATAKCYNPDGTYMARPPDGCPPTEPVGIGGTPSGSKYKNCALIRPATLPPTLRIEGFENQQESNMKSMLVVAGLVGLGLIALLASKR